MSYESPSYNHERESEPEEILADAKESIKSDLENTDISKERIDKYFEKCLSSDDEHFILRGIDANGQQVTRHILKTEELPGSDEADTGGSIQTQKVIADFIKRTLRSGTDIQTLADTKLSSLDEDK